MANKTFKLFADKMGGRQADDYIGTEGEIFYDPTTTSLRISDGETVGGLSLSTGGGADLGNYKISGSVLGTQAEGGGWGAYDMYLDPGGESYSGIQIPSTDGQNNGVALTIYNNRETSGPIQFLLADGSWKLEADGSTTFPTLTVPTSDNANPNGTGQTLKFSDSSQQAIIYGPESNDEYNSAERIIIQGAPGFANTSGEGGDVYLWAGPGGSANGGGGDIKIRAGRGIGDASGGYLTFQGGDSSTGSGGPIRLEAGSSGTEGQGGDIYLTTYDGGDINLSTQGTGAVGISTAGTSWYFEANGAISFPNNTLKSTNAFGIQTPNYIPTSLGGIESTSGSWEANDMTDLETTGGSGNGLVVNITESGGYASDVSIVNPGDGYFDGELITVTSGTSTATFYVYVEPWVWTFGQDGILQFPDGSNQTGAAISIANLKTLVAAAATYADFQTAIAAL
jgi:hypothetical protein